MLGPFRTLTGTVVHVARDIVAQISLAMRSRAQLAAENLFLRKQLALYLERQVKPRRADDATRITLVALSRFVDWRHRLTVVKPETLSRWHRTAFRLWWRWKSRALGRPPIPVDVQQLIATMAAANRTWGRGTDCRRAPRQARHSSLSADRATVHAVATTASETGNTDVEHLRAEPRPIGARQ